MCGERCVCPCDVCVHGMACRLLLRHCWHQRAEWWEEEEEEEEEDRRVCWRGKRIRMRTAS